MSQVVACCFAQTSMCRWPVELWRTTSVFEQLFRPIVTLREAGAVVVVCSHLGRPNGVIDETLRMAPVASVLSELGGFAVRAASDVVGPDAKAAVAGGEPGDVICSRMLASSPARPPTTLCWRKRWRIWPTCSSLTPSAPLTVPMPP